MQGSYKNQGLPRPYYMKPHATKKLSPYDKAPKQFFTSPKRKLMGYLVLIILFGSCMWLVSQDVKDQRDPVYEVVKTPEVEVNGNINKMVNQALNADKEIENVDLAENKAEGPAGKKGFGVAEAPKGGIANEAKVVGVDSDKIVDGATKKKKGNSADRIE